MTGGSLADRGRLGVPEAVRAGREIADALAHAHAHGVVHRDVKPDNVWLDAEGEAALGDFGVAVADGEPAPVAAGTPLYAAPEQARGEAVSERSDLYALGATLYELLCGSFALGQGRLEGFGPVSQRVAGVPDALDALVRADGVPPVTPPEWLAASHLWLAPVLGRAVFLWSRDDGWSRPEPYG
jgi:serine/threonine protein kinase